MTSGERIRSVNQAVDFIVAFFEEKIAEV